MAKSQTSKRDEQRHLTRRALIKWTVAAGAALGVSRSKIFDIIEGSADKELAFAAAEAATTRSVSLVAGNGGLSWYTLFWPHNDIAAGATASNDLAWHKPGMQSLVTGTDNPLTIGPDTPWQSLSASRQVTTFTCGNNETHTRQPKTSVNLNGNNIFSVISALQSSAPSVIPIITIGDVDIGNRHRGERARLERDRTRAASWACSTARRRAPAACSANAERRDDLQGAVRRVHPAQPRGEPLDDEDRVHDRERRGEVPRHQPRVGARGDAGRPRSRYMASPARRAARCRTSRTR